MLLYVHKKKRTFITILGTEAQDDHLDFHTAPERCAGKRGVEWDKGDHPARLRRRDNGCIRAHEVVGEEKR